MRVWIFVFATLLSGSVVLYGQDFKKPENSSQIETLKTMVSTVCYAGKEDHFFNVPAPEIFQRGKYNPATRVKTANIEVTYIGFGTDAQDAQAAFQEAVDIWESLISSPVTIRIEARWRSLAAGVLGSAGTTSIFRNFPGAQKLNVWYPIVLAEKLAGRNLNENEPDIVANFNRDLNSWHFNTSSPPASGKFDFVTVVMHEIGHGLGITGGFTVSNSQGSIDAFGTGLPMIYDVSVENNLSQNIIETFASPSPDMATQLSGGNLFFDSNFTLAKIYAPSSFSPGSSIYHLNDETFDGTSNALMTHAIAPGESIRDPGIALNLLNDLGWKGISIKHTPLARTEDLVGPYNVKANIEVDEGATLKGGSVKLHYTLNGTTFTDIAMGLISGNEYSADIPSVGLGTDYGYYISSEDATGRLFVNPGKIVEKLKTQVQQFNIFSTGPDTEAPVISHSPKGFLIESDTELKIAASITDNLGIEDVTLNYFFNGVEQPAIILPGNTDGSELYAFTISLPLLAVNDEVSYRIKARDLSEIGTPGGNLACSPSATELHIVPVVGLEPTQDSYTNNFNASTTDFFGNGFSVTEPSGFNDGAIHSAHPYPEGNTFPGGTVELIYQLKIPIRVKAAEATIVFDEIVLAEPGEVGSVFGSQGFFDYVVVEGSNDGGITWTPVANGYDSRSNAVWLNLYNSALTGNNSTAVGTPSVFFKRTLNLLTKFSEGDEVVIRFRLFSDPFAAGWGWAIDNLKIQIDETPPTILHDHFDYLKLSAPTLPITIQVEDNSGVNKLFVDYKVNNGNIISEELPVAEEIEQYTLNLSFTGLVANDLIEYQIRSSDTAGNEGTLPVGSFFKVPAINFGAPVSQYASDFNSANSDFVGNFFSVSQPSGFSNGAIQSDHPYLNGFGLTNSTSSYSFTLTKPVTISSTNPFILFSEVVLVEYSGTNNKDFVMVEGSKDGGIRWENFVDPYSSLVNLNWKNTYDAGGSGSTSLYKTRLIDLTTSGKFIPGDNVLIRFRLSADAATTGWGWAIDNLSIQGPVTAIETGSEDMSLSVYPNPASAGKLAIEIQGLPASEEVQIQIMNLQGRGLINQLVTIGDEKTVIEYSVGDWADGMYFVRLTKRDGSILTKKFIKATN